MDDGRVATDPLIEFYAGLAGEDRDYTPALDDILILRQRYPVKVIREALTSTAQRIKSAPLDNPARFLLGTARRISERQNGGAE